MSCLYGLFSRAVHGHFSTLRSQLRAALRRMFGEYLIRIAVHNRAYGKRGGKFLYAFFPSAVFIAVLRETRDVCCCASLQPGHRSAVLLAFVCCSQVKPAVGLGRGN